MFSSIGGTSLSVRAACCKLDENARGLGQNEQRAGPVDWMEAQNARLTRR